MREKEQMNLCGITDTGKVRKINQDVCLTYSDDEKGAAVLVVCDGMGGAKAGNIASAMAAGIFMESAKKSLDDECNIIDLMQRLNQAVREANAEVYEKSVSDPDCSGMGTTLVAAVVTAGGTVVVNVGDSRAYHVTRERIKQVTKDHSVVEDMIDRGDIKRSEASRHPNRNLITRALGTSLDTQPDIFFLNLHPGDYLLLCTDGLSSVVSEHVLMSEISGGAELSVKCEHLIRAANDKGAPDNVTAVLFSR
jgi:serine/threonine protein phosphatase PrpC